MRRSAIWCLGCSLTLMNIATAQGVLRHAASGDGWAGSVSHSPTAADHVLLISIDGAHALDLATYIKSNPNSALADLSRRGITYTNASLPLGDFFPGVLSMVTGGSPIATGVFYDEVYDRSLSPPGSNCSTRGTEVVYDETIDINDKLVDGGGGINEDRLPRDPKRGCAVVYPHDFLRVNTIFEVIKAAGRRTAWSDKHLCSEIVTGPSGKGIDDLYIREVGKRNVTTSAAKTESYDDLRVQAVINEIDGFNHSRQEQLGVPAILGMTFQAVAVAQKLPGDGYLDASGTPSAVLQHAFDHTDQSIGRIVDELKARKLLSSTFVIVSSVHGSSPVDPKERRIVDDDTINKIVGDTLAKVTQDTIALLWLKDQTQTKQVAAVLGKPANKAAAAIQEILWGESLKLRFDDPLTDGRIPDIIVKPQPGVYYAAPTATKIAEHGGLGSEDTNVPLMVAGPGVAPGVIRYPVGTAAIAPTILRALDLDPMALQAVRIERTPVLPGLLF